MAEHRREVARRHLADGLAVDDHRAARSRRRATPFGGDAHEIAGNSRARAPPSAPACPRNSGLSKATTHARPACSGEMPGPSSCPWSGKPASRRSVSRAPRPAGWTPPLDDRRPQRFGLRRRHRHFEPGLAGVAGSGDDALDAVPRRRRDSEATDRGGLRPELRDPLLGLGSLHGEHGAGRRDVVAADRARARGRCWTRSASRRTPARPAPAPDATTR